MKAGQASSNLKKVLKQLGINSKIVRKIAIATYEAEMNIIIHSEGGSIDASIDPEKVKIIVRDRGPGIKDIELAMKAGYSTASQKVRELGFGAGMGLPNIKRCCDEFAIRSSFGEYTELSITIYHSGNNTEEGGE
ncbi:MAG: ATP-binding protein [Clostridiaceae bacterium]|nr:ATP-binding protein [Clostridiaceae bacterium]